VGVVVRPDRWRCEIFPTAFNGETRYLSSPEGIATDECAPLSIADVVDADGRRIVLSCWKLTKAELEEVNRTGRVWLGVWGVTMPPVWLVAHNPLEPFDAGNAASIGDD
jgi:hypothetical protein